MSASGYRNRTTGALTSVGTNGDYWSSAPTAASNTYAGAMAFNSDVMYPWHNEGRAIGFSVRCVQHLQAAFLQRIPTFHKKPPQENLRGLYLHEAARTYRMMLEIRNVAATVKIA